MPTNSSTAAGVGNKNASNAMDKSPMRLVEAKQKERTVVAVWATERANISDDPQASDRISFGKISPVGVIVKL
jgi:hypothetical protein